MKLTAALLIVLALLAAPMTATSSSATHADILDRASTYVRTFVAEFSTVVAEEHYVQQSHPPPTVAGPGFASSFGSPSSKHVDLRSDYLFVRSDASANWLTFRDVFSVDGREVRDRSARLAKLFEAGPRNAVEQAWMVARESHRYDIGPSDRTIANPLLALTFLQPEFRPGFGFTVSGLDVSSGADVWIFKFNERARPTVIRSADNRDSAASGRFWIDGATGRVLQTELRTPTGDRVMTTFKFDDRLRLVVPAEMRDVSWTGETSVTGVATYTNFRRFEVATAETIK